MRDQLYMKPLDWGYPVNYGKENEFEYDVVIVGGGLAGCHAAINARKKGVTVALLDKGPVVRSGCGGTGNDHWHSAHTNPASQVTPEEAVDYYMGKPWMGGKYCLGHQRYIECTESWETLMDLEKWGVPFRDLEDEFKGAPFRDEKTKIMYAYDYEKKTVVRLRGGALMKPLLKAEVDRMGVDVYDFTMGLRLLTEGGKQGAKVIGATGLNIRTGEFYIFKAKSVVICCGKPHGLWNQSYELNGTSTHFWDPNGTGEAHVMAYKAGAELTMMEANNHLMANGQFGYHPYSVGNTSNTWYGARVVDANETLVYYSDGEGNVLSYDDLNRGTAGVGSLEGFWQRDVAERIKKGELQAPFYIDFPGMDPHERRALWGLMIGNEGKTNYSVYKMYQKWGFDPEKDMIQVPVHSPDTYLSKAFWNTMELVPKQNREQASTGNVAVVDWKLKMTLDGLYAAGYLVGNNYGAGASTTGRYAGRNAAEYAKTVEHMPLDRNQIDEIKELVYAPATRKDGIGWKEFKQGLARNMQDHCADYKSDSVMKHGLAIIKSIREGEGEELYARNPHELGRAFECQTQMVMSEMVLIASLARKASDTILNFYRVDYPEVDPKEWEKYITIKEIDGNPVIGELPLKYWLKEPYAPTYKENYEANKAKN